MENAREGIYWLLRASEQGHVEATAFLKQCLEDGKGSTHHASTYKRDTNLTIDSLELQQVSPSTTSTKS